jgi:hypothetical protein
LVKKHQDYPLKCGFLRAWIYEVGSDDTGNLMVVFRKYLYWTVSSLSINWLVPAV